MKSFKKLLLLCLLLFSATMLSACRKAPEPYDAAELSEFATQYVMSIITLDDASIDLVIDQYVAEQNVVMQNGLNSWKDSREELGEFYSIGLPETEELTDGGARVTFISEFENRNCEIIVSLDKRRSEITELTFNPVYTLGEKLSQALVNLAVGMGTVFAVLIFLTWIISLFKHVNKLTEKPSKKEIPGSVPEATEKIQPETSEDDSELVAVMAAAIEAYEEDRKSGSNALIEKKPALENGLRVRSYRR